MEPRTETASAFTPRIGEEGPGAPQLSVWALVALLAGLVSAVAMISPLLWSVAGAALVLCVVVKIYLSHQRGNLGGSQLATIGLALSLIFVTAAPARQFLRQWNIRQQSADVGSEWLHYLVRKEPYNAYESMRPVSMRRPLSSQLEWQYTADKNEAQAYAYFLNNSLVKAISLLPPRVQVRHYETEKIETNSEGADIISDVFALTWQGKDDKPESMLVRLEIERQVDPTRVAGLWRILNHEIVSRPK